MESLLRLSQAPATKQFKNVPISTSVFFSGLWTQRSPFSSPDTRYYSKFLGGRTDILIDGSNVELTNYGTLIRRPGTVFYSSGTLTGTPLSFYSFHPLGGSINVIADTSISVQTVTASLVTTLFTKAAGAGQGYYQGVGNNLYIGDGVEQKKWLFANAWQANTVYATGNYILDASGNVQQATVPGTSGPIIPSFSGTIRGTVVDNTITWTNRGNQIAGWGEVTPGQITVSPPTSPDIFQVRFWAPNHTYGAGGSNLYTIFDQPSNSMFLLVDGTQTTSAVYPNFNSIFTSVTNDGTAQWVCIGNQLPALQFYKGASQVFIKYSTLIDQNGNIQTTLTGGTTGGGTSLPVFNTTVGGTITDGTITWTCLGQAGLISPSYTWGAAAHLVDGHYSPLTMSTTVAVMGNNSNFSFTVTGPATGEGQVDTFAVFRTVAGETSNFFLSGTVANPGTGNWTFTDTVRDVNLQKFVIGDTVSANAPPPTGLVKMTYHLNRMWGVVGNLVYFSALIGDETQIGVGVQCWPSANVFVFPNTVNRLMPIASGLLVFTTDDIYIISGTSRTGASGPLLTSQLFQQGVGLLSYNALDVEGNQIFLYTSDKQFLSFTAAGPIETGFPIGVDLQSTFNPTSVYVASLIGGTQDKAVFISDGSTSWFRCNWNQPPEGGPAWSPKASITGGITAIASIETSPGVHQLLIGQSGGAVLVRSYSTFSDNGTSYTAFATIGSMVLAVPGQLAGLQSIVLELKNVGSVPAVSVMLDEISGSLFETLVKSVNDPPRLAPSQTVLSRRWYLSQGDSPAWCRHIQLKISFAAEAFKNEVLTVTAIGTLVNEE